MRYYRFFMTALAVFLVCFNFNLSSAKDHDKRVKVFTYDEDSVYELIVIKDFQTILELGDDETVQTVSLGTPYAWTILPVGKRVFIKPHEKNIHTNMTIISNKHAYNFDIKSKTEKDVSSFPYVVRFEYHPNN